METNNRQPISVSLPPETIQWLDKQVETRKYASRSHCIELLVLNAMRESAGSAATTPTSFTVEREFRTGPLDASETAELKDLKGRFMKALDQAASMRMSSHVVATSVKGQRRLFYALKKLSESVKPDSTVQSYLALNQELVPVRLTVTMTRDPQGYPGRLEGAEEPISREEAKEYDLSADKVLALIQRFVGGDLW